MASRNDPPSESTGLTVTDKTAALLALGAIVAAALPHFFLQMPLGFYVEGNLNGWLGLSIWGPAFLSSVALFVGVDAAARREQPWIDSIDMRMAAAVTIPIAVVAALAVINFDGYQHIGDWGILGLAMLVYAGIFGIGTFFWQGLLQHVVLRDWPALLRPFVAAALGAAIWLPFLAGHPWSEVGEPLAEYGIVYLGLAVLFELGWSVFACAGVGALIGVGYAWAHQMTFF